MAVTVKQALNRVLAVLGEDEIATSVTELDEGSYEALVLEFLNLIKEEIEEAHNWRALRAFETVTVSANAVSGDVTNANEASRILRISQAEAGGLVPVTFDVTDSDDPSPLREMDLAELLYRQKLDPDERADEEPEYFALDALGASTPQLYVWPRPDSNRTITLGLITPQARFERDDLGENIKIPIRPLVTGTLWYAFEERGEELGINAVFSEERFRKALDDAIARDSAEQGDTAEAVPV